MTEERLPFRAEVSRLLDIVVHSLYSEKEIFLRELISNASDACDKVRYMALQNPSLTDGDEEFRITLAVDPQARTLTVDDNGIGMSREELIENLGTIAQSGTDAFVKGLEEAQKGDLSQIGQFGVGFYASFMVAQVVEVSSRKAGQEEAWSWRSDGRGSFTVEPARRERRGTSVTLYLKQGEDAFLDQERLKNVVKLYSDHIAVPIVFEDAQDAPLNRASALWLRSKDDVTQEQYKEFYHHVAHAFEDPALTLHWKAEGKIEYSILLFVPGIKPYDLFDPKRRHGVKLYVKRVYITDEAEGLVPPYLRFLRGVIDSEDLPLNVSREMLQNNPLLAKIRHGVTRKVLSALGTLASKDEQKYAEVWNHFGAVLKEGLYEDSENREALLGLLRCKTTKEEGLVSLEAYVSRMKEDQKAIYYINGDDAQTLARSAHLEGFAARGIEVLLLTDTVDDFWPSAVGQFKDLPFKSVTRARDDLEAKTAEKETKKERTKDADAALEPLLAFMRETLGSSVAAIKTTTLLTDSPVRLAAGEGDIDIHLERFLKQHGQLKAATPRIVEVNAAHPLILKMAQDATSKGEKKELADLIWLLLDQARLMDGETLADAAAFSRRLTAALSRAI